MALVCKSSSLEEHHHRISIDNPSATRFGDSDVSEMKTADLEGPELDYWVAVAFFGDNIEDSMKFLG